MKEYEMERKGDVAKLKSEEEELIRRIANKLIPMMKRGKFVESPPYYQMFVIKDSETHSYEYLPDLDKLRCEIGNNKRFQELCGKVLSEVGFPKLTHIEINYDRFCCCFFTPTEMILYFSN